ncbi:MAG: diaminopropionate ammonia-lyase [SAR324 cluster bacterium]|nr:diaminopropionate ammonia-lyase [SAR324 cluster bacterium]
MCRYTFNPFLKQNPDWTGKSFDFLRNSDMFEFHKSLEGYEATPLVSLPKIADTLGIKAVLVKDESFRFGINAFKALGASYAIYRFLKDRWEGQFAAPFNERSFSDPAVLEKLGSFTFCAATDGNHGRAVAWTAKKLKQSAVIFMPSDTVQARIDSIRSEGAEVLIIDGTFDDCVRTAGQQAKEKGWFEIADTAYEGYMTIPSWVLNGYSTLFREMENEINLNEGPQIDFVFLQAGVGAFAAAGASYYTQRYGKHRPKLICAEPLEAAGFLDSIDFGEGSPIAAKGKMETIMAGLNCGIPSLAAWPILKDSIELFLAISDDYAEDAMRQFAASGVISGEAGASGLAALLALMKDPALADARKKIGIGEHSRVLLVSTEGDTDPENYQKIVRND